MIRLVEILNCLKMYRVTHEALTGFKMKVFCPDQGTNYTEAGVRECCLDNSIAFRPSMAYEHWQQATESVWAVNNPDAKTNMTFMGTGLATWAWARRYCDQCRQVIVKEGDYMTPHDTLLPVRVALANQHKQDRKP